MSKQEQGDVHSAISVSPHAAAQQTMTLQILKTARELISDRKRWTQRADARDASGANVDPNSDRACSFCSIGALYRVGASSPAEMNVAWDLLRDEVPMGWLSSFNDNRTHAEVIERWDRAIAKLEAA